MRPLERSSLLLLLTFSSAFEASAQCVVANRGDGQPSNGGSIQLKNINLPPGLMSGVRSGYDAWNSCPGANAGFPDFWETYQWDTGQVIELRYVTGTNPNNPESCGYYDPGRQEVVFFASARVGTEQVPCTRPDIFTDTVTHELGHVLGLGNVFGSSCGTFMMGPLSRTGPQTYINRTLHNEECWKVDEIQYTPYEQLLDACAAGDTNACHALGPCEYPDSCNGSPIVLDLAGDGFDFTSMKEGIKFDIDGDGRKELSAWTRRGSDDSFLALDRNRNGRIDGASELFGNSTPLLSGEIARNGFQVLFELDIRTGGNQNGFIDPGDSIYPRLLLWRDLNHDGISSRDELISLREAGVTAIEVAYRVKAHRDIHDNWLRFWGAAYGGDRRIEAVDVFFQIEERD